MSHAVALSDAKTPSRGRAFGAFVIFLVAALLIPVGVIGSWASRTVADTDRYVETVTALIDSPEVRAEVSAQLTNILFDALPTGELAKSVLPNNGQELSPRRQRQLCKMQWPRLWPRLRRAQRGRL